MTDQEKNESVERSASPGAVGGVGGGGGVDRFAPAGGHAPVLLEQVLELLNPQPGQLMLDCTLGRGGHAAAIIPRLAPGGRYIGLDADPANVAAVREALGESPAGVRLTAVHSTFSDARQVLNDLGVEAADLLLADLGFASTQMDDPQRGFAFSADGPLDMRLDPTGPTTAADLVNRLSERELADLIFQYGEERRSRRIARKIVEIRSRQPIKTTREMAEICSAAYGPAGRRSRIDPATRTFQALRIAVNDELGELERLLEVLPTLVRPGGRGGRAAVISFHSLEDRLVKQRFRQLKQAGGARLLTRKPWTAPEAEQAANRRSRSAKCRAIEFIAQDF